MNSRPPIDGGGLVTAGAGGAAAPGTAAGSAGALVGAGAAAGVVVGAVAAAVVAVPAGGGAGAGAVAAGATTGGETGSVPVAAFPPPTSLPGRDAVGSLEQAGSAPSTAQQNDARIGVRV
jgi:hypothetical protein